MVHGRLGRKAQCRPRERGYRGGYHCLEYDMRRLVITGCHNRIETESSRDALPFHSSCPVSPTEGYGLSEAPRVGDHSL